MLFRKGGALLLALMLLLTGCAGEASLVRDSLVATAGHMNYDFQATLKVTGDPESWEEASGQPWDDHERAVAAAFTSGVTMKGSSDGPDRSQIVVELNDDRALRDNGLWTGDQKAQVEVLVDRDALYVTTPLDSKYLKVQPQTAPDGVDPETFRKFHEEMQNLTISFMRSYLSTYGFPLAHAKNHGKVTVELPNGQKVETTRVTIDMDLAEIIRMAMYTAKDAATSEKVRSFAVDLILLVQTYMPQIYPDLAGTEPQMTREQAEALVDTIRFQAQEELKKFEAEYTVERMVDELRQEGLHDFSLKLDYYIGSDKLLVKNVMDISLTAAKPEVTVGIQFEQSYWNYGKATEISLPQAEQTVTLEQLKADPKAIEAFHRNGFLHKFILDANKQTSTIVLDLAEGTASLNGETAPGIKPFVANGTSMVPLRFIGESMGAEVTYDGKTRTAVLVKDGTRLEVGVGSREVKVNGEVKTLAAAPVVKDGVTYVPLRLIEELGADITWIPEVRQAVVQFETSI